MKKKAKKKPTAKSKRSPPKNPQALTAKQIRAELDADDSIWAWCKESGIPTNKNGTFNLVAVAAWLLKESAARQGLVYK